MKTFLKVKCTGKLFNIYSCDKNNDYDLFSRSHSQSPEYLPSRPSIKIIKANTKTGNQLNRLVELFIIRGIMDLS